MTKFHVSPGGVGGAVALPSSKSHTMRAILLGALAEGESRVGKFLPSPDTDHMIHACRMLGAEIERAGTEIRIKGIGGHVGVVEDVIYAGNSGIVLRFISAVAALSGNYAVITGDYSIRHLRPMHSLSEGLKQLNVSVESARGDGFAPLIIKGPLKGGKAVIQGEDSQPVSALLMACPLAEKGTELVVKNPGEKPWIDVTLNWLKRMSVEVINENYERYIIPGNCRYKGFEFTVPGDLSTCSFLIAAALITGSEIRINNVDMDDLQGDKELVYTLQKMGALFEIDRVNKILYVKKGGKLKGIKVDINSYIDAIAPLTIIACFAEGKTEIVNAAIARSKECDRIAVLTSELTKMGAHIIEHEEGLTVEGGYPLKGAVLKSFTDHRMAMSFTVAALAVKGDSTIEGVECISKTYPDFARDLCSLGARLTME